MVDARERGAERALGVADMRAQRRHRGVLQGRVQPLRDGHEPQHDRDRRSARPGLQVWCAPHLRGTYVFGTRPTGASPARCCASLRGLDRQALAKTGGVLHRAGRELRGSEQPSS